MSLLDSIKGMINGGDGATGEGDGESSAHPGLLEAVLAKVQGEGLSEFIQGLSSKGLGDIVKSWVGTGDNLSVSPDQVESALGHDQIGELARKAGIDPAQVKAQLSKILPTLVDRLTPDGQVGSGDFLQQALAVLKSKLG